jgi:hypothetical protein
MFRLVPVLVLFLAGCGSTPTTKNEPSAFIPPVWWLAPAPREFQPPGKPPEHIPNEDAPVQKVRPR